jgi:hypothetical protein
MGAAKKKRAAQLLWALANLARPVAGSALPVCTALWEAEHELSLFHCLRVWAYCIERCYLVDPSFVRHLAVGKGPYPDSGFGFSRFARTDFLDPRRQRTHRP